MEVRNTENKKSKKVWLAVMLLIFFVLGFVVVWFVVDDSANNLRTLYILLYVVSWLVPFVAREFILQREKEKSSPERVQLMAYLDEVAPIPDYNADVPASKKLDYRKSAFLNRIDAAFNYYEKLYKRPLTDREERRIERIVGIKKADYLTGFAELTFQGAGLIVNSILNSAQQSMEEIDEELKRQFGARATLFNKLDKVDFMTRSAEERVLLYGKLKSLMENTVEIDAATQAAESSDIENTPDDTCSVIDPEVQKEIKTALQFTEYEVMQKAKIMVKFEHDPAMKNKQLKTFNHLALKFREERGW